MQRGTLTIRGEKSSGFLGLGAEKKFEGDILVEIDEDKPTIIRYPDGRVYQGEVNRVTYLPEGVGKVTFPNGNIFEGEWQDGEMHGIGHFKWKDGSAYNGGYVKNQKHGKGTFLFPTGNRYEGYWEKGQQHGKGILYSKDNTELQAGEWRRGEFVGEKKSGLF